MYISRAGVITLILNVTMMVLGFYVAKIFASGIEQRKCISLECGLQNGTLAVFVSTHNLFDTNCFICFDHVCHIYNICASLKKDKLGSK